MAEPSVRESVGSRAAVCGGLAGAGWCLAAGAAAWLLATLGGQPVYPLVGLCAGQVR
jgi:hypothetical protein